MHAQGKRKFMVVLARLYESTGNAIVVTWPCRLRPHQPRR